MSEYRRRLPTRPRLDALRSAEFERQIRGCKVLLGVREPLHVIVHELAHFAEIADRRRQTEAMAEFAAARFGYSQIEDSNAWDLSALENCEDMRRCPEDYGAVGRRRLYRVEVLTLALARVAFPEVDGTPTQRSVSRAFRTDLRSWRGRYAGQVDEDVDAAMTTPRVRRLGRRLRRIVEGWMA